MSFIVTYRQFAVYICLTLVIKGIELSELDLPFCRFVGYPSRIVSAAMNGSYAGLITAAHCDTASAVEVAAVLAPNSGHPPLEGIINSGGILADALILSQTVNGMRCAF